MIRRLTLGIALGLVFGTAVTSQAHTPASAWYDKVWVGASQIMRPHNGFPLGNEIERVQDGMQTLNGVANTGNQTISVAFPTSGKGFQNDCAHYAQGENVLYWRPLSAGTRGITHACYHPDDTWKWAQVSFDQDSPWYLGASTTVPNLKYDLQSIATHELLHFNGFGSGASDHFSGGECSDPINTGCGEGSFTTGFAYWRTLESHDKHTFWDSY